MRKTRTDKGEGSRVVLCLCHEKIGLLKASNCPYPQITAGSTKSTPDLTENHLVCFYPGPGNSTLPVSLHLPMEQSSWVSAARLCLTAPSLEALYYYSLPCCWRGINLFWLCDSSDDYTVCGKELGHTLLHAWAVTNCTTKTRQNLVRGDQFLWRQR